MLDDFSWQIVPRLTDTRITNNRDMMSAFLKSCIDDEAGMSGDEKDHVNDHRSDDDIGSLKDFIANSDADEDGDEFMIGSDEETQIPPPKKRKTKLPPAAPKVLKRRRKVIDSSSDEDKVNKTKTKAVDYKRGRNELNKGEMLFGSPLRPCLICQKRSKVNIFVATDMVTYFTARQVCTVCLVEEFI